MAIRVQIFDDNGHPLPEGLAMELVRNREVVATSAIGADGVVVFESDAPAPLAVRLAPVHGGITVQSDAQVTEG